MTTLQTRRSADEDLSLVPAKPRIGDKVFTGLSTGAGILIFVILAAVAMFLLAQAFPALVASPATLQAQGYGPFWSWVAPFAFGTVYSAFWALVCDDLEPRQRAGRLKQWLNLLRRRYPEAERAYQQVRTMTDQLAITAWVVALQP